MSVVDDLRRTERNGWNVYGVDSRAILDLVDDKTLGYQARRTSF